MIDVQFKLFDCANFLQEYFKLLNKTSCQSEPLQQLLDRKWTLLHADKHMTGNNEPGTRH